MDHMDRFTLEGVTVTSCSRSIDASGLLSNLVADVYIGGI